MSRLWADTILPFSSRTISVRPAEHGADAARAGFQFARETLHFQAGILPDGGEDFLGIADIAQGSGGKYMHRHRAELSQQPLEAPEHGTGHLNALPGE